MSHLKNILCDFMVNFDLEEKAFVGFQIFLKMCLRQPNNCSQESGMVPPNFLSNTPNFRSNIYIVIIYSNVS